MRAATLMLATAGILLAAGCGGSKTVTVTRTQTRTRTVTTTRTVTAPPSAAASQPCTGSMLHGTFRVVEGSAGAGQISYALTLTNASRQACFVSGLPVVQLLSASGAALPTNVSAAHPGEQTAAKVSLAPGGSATAEARFSPDVPGVGDQQGGQCQPAAALMRVTATGGGTLVVPLQPPTSVCEKGSLRFDVFTGA